MIRIFGYELRRLLFSKLYGGMLLICLFFGWQILYADTIQGVAHTAPFSPWSFGSYLAQMVPLLSLVLLLMLWYQFSGKAKKVMVLTNATSVEQKKYLLIKCGAVAASWLSLIFMVFLLGAGFLIYLFQDAVSLCDFIIPAFVILIPVLFFVLGFGLVVFYGNWGKSAAAKIVPFLFILVVVAVNLSFSGSLPDVIYFSSYPITLPVLEPGFTMTAMASISKILYSLLGITAVCFVLTDRNMLLQRQRFFYLP